jgi:hypothetical protein
MIDRSIMVTYCSNILAEEESPKVHRTLQYISSIFRECPVTLRSLPNSLVDFIDTVFKYIMPSMIAASHSEGMSYCLPASRVYAVSTIDHIGTLAI